MSRFNLVKVELPGIDSLQYISRQTFQETFSDQNTTENMQQYLDENLSFEKLKSELSNPDSEFYFALLQDKIIGYLKLNTGTAQTENNDVSALEVERIYVLKAYQRIKAGQQLLEKAIQRATEKNSEYVWLGVWEKNYNAINFYTKNGFIPFGCHVFRLGNDNQTDILMKLTLKN